MCIRDRAQITTVTASRVTAISSSEFCRRMGLGWISDECSPWKDIFLVVDEFERLHTEECRPCVQVKYRSVGLVGQGNETSVAMSKLGDPADRPIETWRADANESRHANCLCSEVHLFPTNKHGIAVRVSHNVARKPARLQLIVPRPKQCLPRPDHCCIVVLSDAPHPESFHRVEVWMKHRLPDKWLSSEASILALKRVDTVHQSV